MLPRRNGGKQEERAEKRGQKRVYCPETGTLVHNVGQPCVRVAGQAGHPAGEQTEHVSDTSLLLADGCVLGTGTLEWD